MKKSRTSVFETNSSSSHSITVSDKGYDKTMLPITVNIGWYGEFGWQFEEWSTIEEKIEYMVRCLVCYDYYTDKKEEEDSKLIECIKPIQDKLHGLGIDFNMPTYEEYSQGYVDHEDWYKDEIEDIYDNDDELLKFLLNNDSYIMGGNDNG